MDYLVQSRRAQFVKASNCLQLSFATSKERKKPLKNIPFYAQQGLQCYILITPSTTQSTVSSRLKIVRRSSTVTYIHKTRTVALFWAKPIHLNLNSTWMKLSSLELPCQTQPNSVFTELLRWEGESWDHLVQLLLKLGQLEQVAEDCVQSALNMSKTGDSTTSLGHLCQCLVTTRVKKCFLMELDGFLCVSVCAHCPLSCHCWKAPGSYLCPPFRYLHTLIRSFWTFSSLG